MTSRPLAVALALAACLAAQNPCPPRGLTLTAHGGRLGDAWSVTATGLPNAAGIFGIDVTAGPSNTQIGTVCLGMTSALIVVPMQLDAAGRFSLGGTMPVQPALIGTTFHGAAVALDAAQPSGYAISNHAALAPRPPRVYHLNGGFLHPLGNTPGSARTVDLLSGTVGFDVPLGEPVLGLAFARERNLLLCWLNNSTLVGLHGDTGATVLQVQMPPVNGLLGSDLCVTAAGNAVVAMNRGLAPSVLSPGVPAQIFTVSLDSGTVTAQVALPIGVNPGRMLAFPDTSLVLLSLPAAVIPYESSAGVILPATPLPTGHGDFKDWGVHGGVLYCLQYGVPSSTNPAMLSAVVPLFPQVLASAPLNMPLASLLRLGPGTTGPSAFVTNLGGPVGIQEYSLATLQQTGTMAAGIQISTMELSALGTQWLMTCEFGTCGNGSMLTMPVGTSTVSAPTLLPAGAVRPLVISPSVLLGQAAIRVSGGIMLLQTDPFQLGPVIALPPGGLAFSN